jgi:hypothetical protein
MMAANVAVEQGRFEKQKARNSKDSGKHMESATALYKPSVQTALLYGR